MYGCGTNRPENSKVAETLQHKQKLFSIGEKLVILSKCQYALSMTTNLVETEQSEP